MPEFAIGIDIGGTNTKFGIVDRDGKILHRANLKTDDYPLIVQFVDGLYQQLMPLMKKLNKDSVIKGIGIGAPNGNYYTGTIEYAPNLQWKGIIPLVKLVSEKFHLPEFH